MITSLRARLAADHAVGADRVIRVIRVIRAICAICGSRPLRSRC
jgi:hypothetical protein